MLDWIIKILLTIILIIVILLAKENLLEEMDSNNIIDYDVKIQEENPNLFISSKTMINTKKENDIFPKDNHLELPSINNIKKTIIISENTKKLSQKKDDIDNNPDIIDVSFEKEDSSIELIQDDLNDNIDFSKNNLAKNKIIEKKDILIQSNLDENIEDLF